MWKGCASVEKMYGWACTKLSSSNNRYRYLHVSDKKYDGMLSVNSRVPIKGLYAVRGGGHIGGGVPILLTDA